MPNESSREDGPGEARGRRRRVLSPAFFIAVLAALALGWILGRRGEDPGAGDPPPGRLRPSPRQGPGAAGEKAEDLRAVPYLQGYRPARDLSSVTVFDRRRAAAGLNLYVSGHGEEAVLMDMEGTVLHRWRQPLRRAFPQLDPSVDVSKLRYWRRAWLYPDGDLLAIFETLGLIRLDRRSNLLWAYRSDAHHDLFVDPQGDIWVLDRRGRLIPRLHRDRGVLEDLVTVLDPENGEVRRQFSIVEAFERSAYRSMVVDRPVRHGDIFHTNTLERLDGRQAQLHPAFREGHLLISVLQLNAVAVIDPQAETVVWALGGLWRKQHQPVLLPGGTLMVFDNLGAGGQRSRVLEVDPFSQETVWSYGAREGQDLYSKTLGSCQRLANGNTLITESENGRAVEVTAAGEIVWEFHNPHRSGPDGELVATLFEVVRLPADFPFRGGGP